jgi:hypothetical protein
MMATGSTASSSFMCRIIGSQGDTARNRNLMLMNELLHRPGSRLLAAYAPGPAFGDALQRQTDTPAAEASSLADALVRPTLTPQPQNHRVPLCSGHLGHPLSAQISRLEFRGAADFVCAFT